MWTAVNMWSPLNVLFLITIVHYASTANRGFILTAPKNLLAGSVESICISLHNTSGPAHVTLDLLHTDTDVKISSSQHTIHTDTECVELVVPATAEVKGRLRLQAKFHQMFNYSVNSEHEIYIQQRPIITLIQTDKPVYKPGQLVRFRILSVNHDLKPIVRPIAKVWLESPSDVRLAQWLDLKTKKGLVHLEFQLSKEPIQGDWKIKVDRNTSIETKIFTVREYVLPRFEVTITPPDYIQADAETLTWKVCAKYSYGQPVKGRVHIKATPEIYSWIPMCDKTKASTVQDQSQSRRPMYGGDECIVPPLDINVIETLNGCYMFNVTGQELGLFTLDKHSNTPAAIKVTASVAEANTDIERNATLTSPVIHHALHLEFVPHSPQYFKPGLPYQGKVRVLYPNSVPAPKKYIQVCLKTQEEGNWQRNLVGCRNFTSDKNGFVHYTIPPPENVTSINLYSLTATALNHEAKYYSPEVRWSLWMNQPTASHDVQAWYSPSNSYIEITDEAVERPRCNYHHTFRVHFVRQPNTTLPMFYYLVKARGDLIVSGHVLPLPVPDTLRLDNVIVGNTSTDRAMSDLLIEQFGLKMLILPKMSPLSQLMIYYVRSDGETVATTFEIHAPKCFANKVSAGWQAEQQFPGSPSVFHLAAAPHSLCSISAVDKSTTFLAATHGASDFNNVFSELERFHTKRDTLPMLNQPWNYKYCKTSTNTPVFEVPVVEAPVVEFPVLEAPVSAEPVAEDDLRRRRRSFMHYFHSSQKTDAVQAFDDFGVIVMSDLTIDTKPCIPMTYGDRWNLELPQSMLARGGMGRGMDYDDDDGIMVVQASVPVMDKGPTMAVASTTYSQAPASAPVEVRSFFPETWLWDLVDTGRDGRAQIRTEVPHTITDWIGSAVCLSTQQGLGMSDPTHLTAFQPFFLELALPYSVKRGEVVQIKVALFNFLPHNLPVRLTFESSVGVELLSDDPSASQCVSENANWVHHFRVRANELGDVNLTVSAEVDSEFPKECGPESIVHRKDVLIKPLLVKPEGFPLEITKSAFICPSTESSAEDKSVFWKLELPADVVAGSARAEVNMAADLMGPTLQNLDKLVQMPMGCGEQNMVLFVPNLHVVNYLTSTYQANPILLNNAVKNMKKGYQRELNYRHTDGSYSAFGNSDPEGSMWLTAFVVKTFAQARTHIFVDEADLQVSLDWISSKQLENGCFPVVGQVLHKDMKGGLGDDGSTSALTAYVLISLLETGLTLPEKLSSNAVFCLNADPKPDVYTIALTTYALTLLDNRDTALEAMARLMAHATVQQELLFWEKPGSNSKALSVEITAYAILALVKLGGTDNLITAHKAVRWMSQHRNSNGGFVSTQDTVVALEALSKYAASLPAGNTRLSVLVTATDLERTFQIRQHDRLLLQRQTLPVLPTQVEIVTEGDGCVLVQSWLRYNVRTARGMDALEMTLEVKPLASVDACTLQSVEACVRYKPEGQTSNMAVLEVAMASGYVPEKSSLKQLDTNPDLKRWEVEEDQVNFYFDSLSNAGVCLTFTVEQEMKVENPLPANARLYDYYEPEVTISKNYQVATDCDVEPLPNPMPVFVQPPNTPEEDSLNVSPANIRMELVNVSTEESIPSVSYTPNLIVVSRQHKMMRKRILPKEGTTPSSTTVSENLSEGLNSDFVDVDTDLEFPEGIEGPATVYALPSGEIIPTIPGIASCPHCWSSFAGNFSASYCNAAGVYKVVVRKPGVIRMLLDLTPRKIPSRMRRLVRIELQPTCDCPQLQDMGIANSNVLLMLEKSAQGSNVLSMDSSVNVWSVPAVQGQPHIVKVARNKCREAKLNPN